MDSDSGSKRSPALSADALLRRNYMFRGLPEPTLQRIAARVGRRIYQKGTVIFSQGEPGDALYGVASGRVRISASGDATPGPGDLFGVSEPVAPGAAEATDLVVRIDQVVP